jgi:hypothetical protein
MTLRPNSGWEPERQGAEKVDSLDFVWRCHGLWDTQIREG